MSTLRISWTSSAPSTKFELYCDRISQSVSGDYTTIRIIIKAYNEGSTSTYSSYGGYHHAWVSGSDYNTQDIKQDVSSDFLPSGVATGALRWSHQRDINIYHDSSGKRGAVTLNQHVNFSNGAFDDSRTYSFDDFPDIDLTTVPDPPTRENSQDVAATSFTLIFHSPGNNGGLPVDEYEMRWGTDSNNPGPNSKIVAPGDGSQPITGLTRNTTYYSWVRAHNSKGWSGWSGWIQTQTLPTYPGWVDVYGVDSITQYSVHFRYENSSGVDNGGDPGMYLQVGYAKQSDSQNLTYINNNSGDITITGLDRNTPYYIWVRSVNSVGPYGWNGPTKFTTLAYLPGPPRWTGMDQITQTTVHISYIGPADDGGSSPLEYQVGYGTDPNNVQYYANCNWGDYVLGGLSPGADWYMWLRCRNAAGWGNWSNRFNFHTVAGSHVNDAGTWKEAIPMVRQNGVWKLAQPMINQNGTWKRYTN